jgi:hypothetical protein
VDAARKEIGRPAGIDTRLVTVWSVSPESASVFCVWVFNTDRSTSGFLRSLR